MFQLEGEQLGAAMARAENVIETHTDYVVQIGSRSLNPRIFSVGPAVFKSMGFDWLYQWLDKMPSVDPAYRLKEFYSGGSFVGDMKNLVRHVSPQKMISILCNGHEDTHYLADVSRMLADYPDGNDVPNALKSQFPNGLEVNFKFKTMKELHDKISTQYTILETEATKKPIPTHPAYLALHGREKDGLRLVVPVDTTSLAIWGKLLNICVASYGDRAVLANTLILGVEKNGEIKYCIEFSPVQMHIVEPGMPGSGTFVSGPEQALEPPLKVALPALEEKHMGVVPPEEKDTYLTPYMVQFRSSRNGSPMKDDENTVEIMLSNWVEEFKDEYEKLGDKAYYRQNAWLNGQLGDAFNQWAINQHGRPDQLIVAPQMYNDLQQAFGVPLRDRDVPPPADDVVDAFQYRVRVVNDVVQNNDIDPLLAEQNPARFQEIANEVLNRLNGQVQDAIVGVDWAANAEV